MMTVSERGKESGVCGIEARCYALLMRWAPIIALPRHRDDREQFWMRFRDNEATLRLWLGYFGEA